MHVQCRENLGRKAADLLHGHLVRQHAAIELIRTMLTPAGALMIRVATMLTSLSQ
jgi:hypothetical protein